MWAANSRAVPPRLIRGNQRGVAAVEFALIAVVFFTLLFGIIEFARAMYIFNTLQEVTRRAAAAAVNTDFKNSVDLDEVRWNAVFRDTAGPLMFAQPITDENVRIDYLSITNSGPDLTMTPITTATLPSSPERNRLVCAENSNDPQCIRLVRVRVCTKGEGDSCGAVPYQTIIPLISLPVMMPTSTTIMTAETLGFKPGTPP
jgi:Flp pilus assembly protein TadG